ncbi:hypothetical protein BCR34DRAFT_618619 [Clohesyomyces aquaticus]|uniref:Uncharacterized protein n=1 Tax=Clohesyomyces aquaticus TaxID=1231657 RepID=A0A1Y1YRE1_9PLEO|nr:hypothetical protein BCR34DRAFT_618619 [Clohesyomyces aquaticus]
MIPRPPRCSSAASPFSRFLAPLRYLPHLHLQILCVKPYTGQSPSRTFPPPQTRESFLEQITPKTTVIPVTTVTPRTVTRTAFTDVTATVTSTAPQTTDTLYTAITIPTTSISSSTSTDIVTSIELTTITVDGGTTSIPTSAGFVPIQSVSGSPPARKRARSEGNARRVASAAQEQSPRYDLENRPAKGGSNAGFKMATQTKIMTSTARKTITSTAQAPKTTTTKTRSHTTSTLATPVHASTTISVSITVTFIGATVITNTLTIAMVNTATVTAATATATAYPGCSPENFISSRNGNKLVAVYVVDNVDVFYKEAATNAAGDNATAHEGTSSGSPHDPNLSSNQVITAHGYPDASKTAAQVHYAAIYTTTLGTTLNDMARAAPIVQSQSSMILDTSFGAEENNPKTASAFNRLFLDLNNVLEVVGLRNMLVPYGNIDLCAAPQSCLLPYDGNLALPAHDVEIKFNLIK